MTTILAPTKNGVRILLSGKTKNQPITFYMRPCKTQNQDIGNTGLRLLKILLFDGTDKVNAILFLRDIYNLSDFQTNGTCVMKLRGYVLSLANIGLRYPLIGIVDFDLSHSPLRITPQPDDDNNTKIDFGRNLVPGGLVNTFLMNWAVHLSDNELSGIYEYDIFPPVERNHEVWRRELKEKCKKISEFVKHHMGIQNSTNSFVPDILNNNVYASSLSQFRDAQVGRQKASVMINGCEEVASKAAEQNQTTLLQALLDAEDGLVHLTIPTICRWHKSLCGNGVLKDEVDAGRLRQRNLTAGATIFQPYTGIRQHLQEVCDEIRKLESRLSIGNYTNTAHPDSWIHLVERMILFSSITLMCIADTHPFCDGNGRLSRIAFNWALRRAGFPFTITLFANSFQRCNLISAIKSTRRNINLVKYGSISEECLLDCHKISGTFSPLIEVVVDCIYKAVIDFETTLTEKLNRKAEADESKIERQCRERAVASTCIICLEDSPNISTLCCGKPLHLNCMTEWIRKKNSCPNCRFELPKFSQSETKQEHDETAEVDDDDTHSYVEQLRLTAIANGWISDDEETEYVLHPMAVPESMLTIGGQTEETEEYSNNGLCIRQHCLNLAARDCANSLCGRCCIQHGMSVCLRHDRFM